ncbi:fused MFS/spermidine synthase [Aliisedimentitalea sp. MJ-SS2]|uniref:fused MFS/spermidine synthase n=1 Tax=Aliisedimentitalea sp. MJ-SS2 TaxID=3049795 RepID=UPI0029318F68|nr:fused MFS/spermidine synthase [Alisedimentitalea sp. MJ-SS2]
MHLTTFYLVMSVGGALGGVFNSLVAPVAFDKAYEGPIVLLLALLVGMYLRPKGTRHDPLRAIVPQIVLVIGFIVAFLTLGIQYAVGFVCFMIFVAYKFAPNRIAVTSTLIAASCAGLLLATEEGSRFQDRSFFGTHRVLDTRQDDGSVVRVYKNGSTVHGAQLVAPQVGSDRPQPLTYYYSKSPMAQAVTSGIGGNTARVGIVGLGTGALVCYAQPDQKWDLYEIDPMVDRVARDSSLFTFISSCAPDAPTHIGDARIVLQQQTDKEFDVLVIDAYSSDAVPVHLTTLEAMQLYKDRLSRNGVLVYHISNRYYDIERPLARSARALGLRIWKNDHTLASGAIQGATGSNVVILARSETDAAAILARDANWYEIQDDGGRLWTDDYANPLGILRGF